MKLSNARLLLYFKQRTQIFFVEKPGDSIYSFFNKLRDWVDDVGGDALARCSDCEMYPAEEECRNLK